MRQIFWTIILLAFTSNVRGADQGNTPTRVLFIGNSYTYYHSMPQLFKAMAEARFPSLEIDVKFLGQGGATLKQLWETGEAPKEIRFGRWNYIVLQEQSMLGGEIIKNGKSYVRAPDEFYKYAKNFVLISLENGVEPVFFMTWSRKGFLEQQKYLTYAYMNIAKQTKAKIAPVGIAWDKLRTTPDFDLYEQDGSHPSVYGSYLAALILFSTVFDTDPMGVPGHLKGYEILEGGRLSEQKSLLCDLPENDVKILQEASSEILQMMKTGNGYLEVEKAVSDKKPSQFSKLLTYLTDSRNQFFILMITVGIIFVMKGSLLLVKNRRI